MDYVEGFAVEASSPVTLFWRVWHFFAGPQGLYVIAAMLIIAVVLTAGSRRRYP